MGHQVIRCPHCHGTDWLPTLRASDDPDWSWDCAWCGLPMPEASARYLRRLLDPYVRPVPARRGTSAGLAVAGPALRRPPTAAGGTETARRAPRAPGRRGRRGGPAPAALADAEERLGLTQEVETWA